jgi:membrane protease YdiL (CAAX protease family)
MTEVPTVSVGRNSWLQRILAPVPSRGVPWSGSEVVVVVLLLVVLEQLVQGFLESSGFYRSLYDPGLLAQAQNTPVTDAVRLARDRLVCWAMLFSFPIKVLALLLLLFATSGARPSQLGLTWQRGWQNLGLGVAGSVVLTPVVLGINGLVIQMFKNNGIEVEDHHFVQMSGQLMRIEWLPLLFVALVSAPVMEELTLRGLLQPWLAQRRWGGMVAALLALLIALASRDKALKEAYHHGEWTKFSFELQPALFVVAMSVGLLLVQRRSRTPIGPAVYGTSLLFAALHSSVWPSPIALFVLGLGLGWLAQRTQSMVGPILLHCLFNAVGCLGFLIR